MIAYMSDKNTELENPYKPTEAEITDNDESPDAGEHRDRPIYLESWTSYFDFRGRSRRREYWVFYLINVTIYVFLTFGVEWFFIDQCVQSYLHDSHVGSRCGGCMRSIGPAGGFLCPSPTSYSV